MKKILSLILVTCFSATLVAQTIVSTEPANRNMILEEFTGKTCQYCPDGHRIAQQLMNQYPEKFFAVNVHQGGFASGTPNYTTPYGDALASQAGMGLNNTGYPGGTVNRQLFTGVPLMGSSYFLYDRGRWASCASKGFAEPSCLNVAAEGVLDWEARKLTLLVEVYYTGNAVQGTNKLTVAMLQNEVLGPQTGGGTYNPDMVLNGRYRHQHMLRDFITGQWGMDVTPTTEGSFWSHTFEYIVPKYINNVWVALENLEFLVYVAENEKTIITGSRAQITDVNECYSVIASSGPNGSISTPGDSTYAAGANAEYFFTPNPKYEVREVYINEVSLDVGNVSSYTIENLEHDQFLHVLFRYNSSIDITEGGDVSISVELNRLSNKLIVTGSYDQLEIISISGQLMATAYNQPSVDVSHLAKGIYIVNIQSNGQTSTCKVVKQ